MLDVRHQTEPPEQILHRAPTIDGAVLRKREVAIRAGGLLKGVLVGAPGGAMGLIVHIQAADRADTGEVDVEIP